MYGPVCTVVRQGGAREGSPYANQLQVFSELFCRFKKTHSVCVCRKLLQAWKQEVGMSNSLKFWCFGSNTRLLGKVYILDTQNSFLGIMQNNFEKCLQNKVESHRCTVCDRRRHLRAPYPRYAILYFSCRGFYRFIRCGCS